MAQDLCRIASLQSGFSSLFGCSWFVESNVGMRKKIFDTALCEVCERNVETADHIVSGRPFARTLWVWAKLGFNGPAIGQPPPQTTCTALGRPASTPLETFQHFAAGSSGSEAMGVVFGSTCTSNFGGVCLRRKALAGQIAKEG